MSFTNPNMVVVIIKHGNSTRTYQQYCQYFEPRCPPNGLRNAAVDQQGWMYGYINYHKHPINEAIFITNYIYIVAQMKTQKDVILSCLLYLCILLYK